MVCRVDNTIGNLINRKIIFQGDFFFAFSFCFSRKQEAGWKLYSQFFLFFVPPKVAALSVVFQVLPAFSHFYVQRFVLFFNCRDSYLRIRMSSRACLRIPRFVEVSNCRRSFFLIAEDSFVSSSEDICEQFFSEEDSAGCFGCRLRFLVFGSLLRGFFIRYFFFRLRMYIHTVNNPAVFQKTQSVH